MFGQAPTQQWLGTAEQLCALLCRGHTGMEPNYGAERVLELLGFYDVDGQIAPYIPPVAPLLEDMGIGGSSLASLYDMCHFGDKDQRFSPLRTIINLVCVVVAARHNLAGMTSARLSEVIRLGMYGGVRPLWLSMNGISQDPDVMKAALPYLEAKVLTHEGDRMIVRDINAVDATSAFAMHPGDLYLLWRNGGLDLAACKLVDNDNWRITSQDGWTEQMLECRKILAINGEWL